MTPPVLCDVIIIGAGHNGLTCANYLAAAGLTVRVLERRAVVGGAAVTETFHPGFRNSSASYAARLLNPQIIQDLRLAQHGLQILNRPLAKFLPLDAVHFLQIGPTIADTQAEVAQFSSQDAERLPAFYAMLESVADVWRECCHETPPNVGGGLQDIVAAIRSGRRLQRLSMAHRRAVLDVLTKSVGDLLDAWFESAALKAALGYEAIAGHYASPYTPGTAYVLLHHMLGEVNGQRGATGHVVGGMGAITEAMAAEARLRGVYIETNVSVEKVIVDQRGAQGVQLQDGRIIEASCVVANVNPKMLYLDMVDAVALDQNFLHTLRQWKCASASFRMNVALSELPNFTCLPNQPDESSGLHHQSSIVMAPSLRYMEQAYFDARTYGCARAPVIEMLIPSTVDDSLAPPGQHVASLCCQHFSPDLPEGLSWDGIREDAADHVIDTVTRFAPNFKSAILGRSILSPLDLEREFGLLGGDIYHGALTLDQLWSARPMLGHADYRGPIRKLYLCGAGAHPGGGVSGLPGRNAAREIVADFKHGKLKHR